MGSIFRPEEPEHLGNGASGIDANVASLLRRAAQADNKTGIITYPSGKSDSGFKTSYSELLLQAEQNAKIISKIDGFKQKSIVLLHLNDHFDSINLFWAIILAGGVPCISTPFTNIPAQREKHIKHLHSLLENPICITRVQLMEQFVGQNLLKPHTIEDLVGLEFPSKVAYRTAPVFTPYSNGFINNNHFLPSDFDDLALLMLTSGSTGNAKAVRLSHAYVFSCFLW